MVCCVYRQRRGWKLPLCPVGKDGGKEEKTEGMKGLDRCWQVILEKEEKDGRKSRLLAAIKLIKVAWVLQLTCLTLTEQQRRGRLSSSVEGFA